MDSRRFIIGNISLRSEVAQLMVSASAEHPAVAVCFLELQASGQRCLPSWLQNSRKNPDVLLQSALPPAQSESTQATKYNGFCKSLVHILCCITNFTDDVA